jgi:hypothetical protein
LDVQVCTGDENSSRCDFGSLAPDTGGRVFFTNAGNIALAQIDEVP